MLYERDGGGYSSSDMTFTFQWAEDEQKPDNTWTGRQALVKQTAVTLSLNNDQVEISNSFERSCQISSKLKEQYLL
jgi:hypothetical protein